MSRSDSPAVAVPVLSQQRAAGGGCGTFLDMSSPSSSSSAAGPRDVPERLAVVLSRIDAAARSVEADSAASPVPAVLDAVAADVDALVGEMTAALDRERACAVELRADAAVSRAWALARD